MSVPARRAARVGPSHGRGAPAAPRRRAAEGPPSTVAQPTAAPTASPVARRRRRHHAGFAVFATVVVGSMVLGIVTLNALLAQQSFRIDEAERQIDVLQTEQVDLVHEQAMLSAPGRIEAWARRNGMRLPDDIRSLHAFGDARSGPAGAGTSSGGEP